MRARFHGLIGSLRKFGPIGWIFQHGSFEVVLSKGIAAAHVYGNYTSLLFVFASLRIDNLHLQVIE
jgi:hypothetical protein